jgi:hypothetical protein
MPMITGYQYDQLNRLRFARSYENMNLAGNSWDYLETYDNRYFNEFVYDPNGNILTQKRHLRNGTQIEDLTYQYHYQNNRLIQNRLYHVNDAIGAGVDATDIDDMGAFTAGTNINSSNNYSYDEEGRLTKDVQEGIDAITWRVDGKVKKIARPVGSGKKNVTFDYDAMGNRIAKHTYDDNWMLEKSTYYVLDAQGNQMNIYEHEVSTENVQYNLVERNMYGSSRLGTFSEKVNMLEENTSTTQTVTLGYKYFELSNHLGNVLTVIKDIKIPIELEGDDEPFEDPGDAPYFNADGTIRFDQLINHPAHTCVNPGLNFVDGPTNAFPIFEDANGDGNIDMKVRGEVPINLIPTRLFFYTAPGQSYTLNFEILSWMNVGIIGVVGMQCGNPFAAGQNTIYTPGTYSYSFIATGAQTEIKWNIFKQQASLPGEITFSNFSFTQGTGPFFSQPLTPPVDPETDISHYEVAIVSVADYSPFNVELDGRTIKNDFYRRSVQGQEHHDEILGEGNYINYKYRGYDPRIGRLDWSIDPLVAKYPFYSPYAFSGNRVIDAVELEGLQPGILFPSSYSYKEMEKNNTLLTDNWQTYSAHTWAAMKESVILFKAQNVNQKIKYVYIQIHGNALGIVVGPEEEQNDFILTESYGVTITPFDLKEYSKYKTKGSEKYKKFNKGSTYKEVKGGTITKRTYDYWADNVGVALDEMFGLFDELPDGTTIVFGACFTGSSEEFLRMFYESTGKRFNFIANTSTTIVTGDVLDTRLSNCSNVTGWVILGVQTAGLLQKVTGTNEEGFIQLQSNGESPITNTKEACPQD